MATPEPRDPPSVSFGPFDFDPSTGVLRHRGRPVALRPQPARLLSLLLARAGEVVSRDEIRRHLWGDGTYVDADGGINTAVRLVRRALDDDAASPRYVETLPGRGYRFAAPVVSASPGAGGPTAEREERTRPLAVLAAVALATLVALGVAIAVALSPRHPPGTGGAGALPRVLAVFVDHSGQESLRRTLADTFRIGLAESSAFRILSPATVRATLAQMGKDGDALAERRNALELGVRRGVTVAVLARCDRVGETYMLSAELLAPDDGRSLAARQVTAELQSLLPALDGLVSELRDTLGTLVARLPARRALPPVATPDLKALQLYARAVRNLRSGADSEEVDVLLHSALERDPAFAMAHTTLGSVLLGRGERRHGVGHLREARRHSHRLSAAESAFVDAALGAAEVGPPREAQAWKRFDLLYPEALSTHRRLLSRGPPAP